MALMNFLRPDDSDPEPRTLIIGVGNDFRGDDGVGFYIARKLKEMKNINADIIEAGGEGTAIMAFWENRVKVIMVDAVSSGAEVGTIYRYNVSEENIPASIFSSQSTHAFGLIQAIELSRTLDKLPKCLIVYGIEGKTFGLGTEMSPEIKKAAQSIIERLSREMY